MYRMLGLSFVIFVAIITTMAHLDIETNHKMSDKILKWWRKGSV